jgi:hypothetical protein
VRGVQHRANGIEQETQHREQQLRDVDHHGGPEDVADVRHSAREQGAWVRTAQAHFPEVRDALFVEDFEAVGEEERGWDGEGGEEA